MTTHAGTPLAKPERTRRKQRPAAKRHKATPFSTEANKQPYVAIHARIGQTLAEKATRLSPVGAVAKPTSTTLTGLIAGTLAVAMIAFALGAMPTRYIRSGRVAYALAMRRVEVTLVGVPLLLIAVLTIALTIR